MSLTFSFDYIDYITASLRRVQGVILLGLLWKLRCHAEYSRAASIALRRFGLGNPHLAGVITSMTDCRMQRSSVNLLIADVSQSVLRPKQSMHLLGYMRCGVSNCLPPQLWYVPLDYCSTNSGFILMSVVLSCHSVAAWQLADLWLLRHATLPLGFPSGISRMTVGLIFIEL